MVPNIKLFSSFPVRHGGFIYDSYDVSFTLWFRGNFIWSKEHLPITVRLVGTINHFSKHPGFRPWQRSLKLRFGSVSDAYNGLLVNQFRRILVVT